MDVLDALTIEWDTLARSSESLRRYQRWAAGHAGFRFWFSAADLVRFAQDRGHPDASDRSLALLARLAPDDDLAARALLQSLQPGLRALAVRYHWLAAHEDVIATTVSLAWEHIRTYPYEQRPRRIAANVLCDVEHHLRRAFPIERCGPLADGDVDVPAVDPGFANIEVVDLAARHLDADGAAIVMRTRVLDEPVATLAAEFGCSIPALRERRRRAEDKLRTVTRRTLGTHQRRVAS